MHITLLKASILPGNPALRHHGLLMHHHVHRHHGASDNRAGRAATGRVGQPGVRGTRRDRRRISPEAMTPMRTAARPPYEPHMVSMWVSWRRDGLEPWILPGGWDSWCGVPGRGWLCGPAQGISPATRPGSWSRCLTSCRGACDEDNPASPDRGVPVLCSCARPRTGESASAGRRRSWGGRARRFAVPRHRPAVHHGSERHRPAANH